jgi:hypothetical protein
MNRIGMDGLIVIAPVTIETLHLAMDGNMVSIGIDQPRGLGSGGDHEKEGKNQDKCSYCLEHYSVSIYLAADTRRHTQTFTDRSFRDPRNDQWPCPPGIFETITTESVILYLIT